MTSWNGLRVSPAVWRRQMTVIFTAWGMTEAHAEVTADVLTAADLMGIDSHGLTLFPLYDEQIRNGGAQAAPEVAVVRDVGAVALLDGDAGFGQVPGMMAVEMAAERARRFGIGAVSIRNSNHYGAAGVYARRLGEQGLIGLSTSSVWRAAIVPTGGLEPKLGTNPIAFAAPSRHGKPFLLDMATSTAAIGKLRLAERAEVALPEGWVQTREGAPQRDPRLALLDPLLVPLGGHKGYGLAVMVEILSTVLSGAAITPLRGAPGPNLDVGHFVLALDPAALRGTTGAFEADLDAMIEGLRSTEPRDPGQPVMVAGDPEYTCEADRLVHGIPLPPKLAAQIRKIAQGCGAEFLFDREAA